MFLKVEAVWALNASYLKSSYHKHLEEIFDAIECYFLIDPPPQR